MGHNGGHISFIPDEIMHNIFDRLPVNLLAKLIYVCKRWNRVISDPCYLNSWLRGDRKILLPFVPVDVLYENDTTRSMVTLDSSPFANPGSEGNVVTFGGSCNGIVLLVIQLLDKTHLVLYNPLTSAKKAVPDDLHSQCNNTSRFNHHVYGFGYGSSTPDDVKIVRFRGCESYWSSSDDNRHTCDVFSPKTNSWIVLKNFVRNANWLNDVGTFANGRLYWISNSEYNDQLCKIVALDVNKMKVSYIRVPFDGLFEWRRYMSSFLGTLHGRLCVVAQKTTGDGKGNRFKVWVMREKGVKKRWLEASSFELNLKSEFRYSPVSILDDGIVLILTESFQELVIYDLMKDYPPKVINISASPSYFRRSHGIEYVESLVSPSSLFN